MTETDIELEENTKEQELRLYELGYHLLPTIAEEAVSEAAGLLKDSILKHAGVVLSDQMPRMLTLAYSMPKIINEKRKYFDTALFGWIKFHMSPAGVLEFEHDLKQDKSILRFILIKTAQEKALPLKKMVFLKGKHARPQATVEKKKKTEMVLSEEELDKTIEGLVVE